MTRYVSSLQSLAENASRGFSEGADNRMREVAKGARCVRGPVCGPVPDPLRGPVCGPVRDPDAALRPSLGGGCPSSGLRRCGFEAVKVPPCWEVDLGEFPCEGVALRIVSRPPCEGGRVIQPARISGRNVPFPASRVS